MPKMASVPCELAPSHLTFITSLSKTTRIQTEGLGGLRPNTIILCWPLHWKKDEYSYTAEAFIRKSLALCRAHDRSSRSRLGSIAIAEARQCAVIVPKNIDSFPDNKQIQDGTIDIWWIIHDGGLLFLIAFLLKRNKVWSRCRIRLFTVAQLEDNSVEMKKDLEQYMYQLRIEAEVDVVEMVRRFSVVFARVDVLFSAYRTIRRFPRTPTNAR